MFKTSIDILSKKLADMTAEHEAAQAARKAATAEEVRVCADVATRSHGGVTTPADQLALVVAQRARIEAEDAAHRAECRLAVAAAKLGVARKDPDALARDPETLLRDLSRIGETIAVHEKALNAARTAWAERMRAAQTSLSRAQESAEVGAASPLPLPAPCDEIGRALSVEIYLAALSTMVDGGHVPGESEELLFQLRLREKELRATIERQQREEEKREKERRRDVLRDQIRRDADARSLDSENAERERAARRTAEENDRLAAAHAARVA
jgi:hypothetical protein